MSTELREKLKNKNHQIVDNSISKFRVGLAVSEWNEEITNNLKKGAEIVLKNNGFNNKDIVIKKVPGSFELPLTAKYLIDYAACDAVICLGCVIQGETRHFDFVCQGVTQGIMDLNINLGKPVAFGVLTTNNQQQAKERAGGRLGNKGEEAAIAVLKMLRIKTELLNDSK